MICDGCVNQGNQCITCGEHHIYYKRKEMNVKDFKDCNHPAGTCDSAWTNACACCQYNKTIWKEPAEEIMEEEIEETTLAEQHWSYTEKVLVAADKYPAEITLAKCMYIEAFNHGYKHAVEDRNVPCTVQ